MTEPLGIALLGCGVVGAGVARVLLEQPERLASRAGRPLELRRVVVRDPGKRRPVSVPADLVTTDCHSILKDGNVHVVVEVAGGTDFARTAVLAALESGKDVVTANKALLAAFGDEIFAVARRLGRTVAFEASVAGGIPIISALTQGLAANQVLGILGILNGTCNYILTEMSEHGRGYEEALAEAQRLGYAEADPTLDLSGADAAQKLALLARIAFGVSAPVAAVTHRGINDIQLLDVRFARELGYTIKLLAEAWLDAGELALHVSPVLLRHSSPLAQVRGGYNAIQVIGDVVGDTLYYGPGAGGMPTASAVVADLIDLAVGRAQRTFAVLFGFSRKAGHVPLRSPADVRSRFYLRILVQDRPGIQADIARELADRGISISSFIQHEALDGEKGETVPIVLMTQPSATGAFREAVAGINRLPGSAAPCVYFPAAD